MPLPSASFEYGVECVPYLLHCSRFGSHWWSSCGANISNRALVHKHGFGKIVSRMISNITTIAMIGLQEGDDGSIRQ